MHHIKGLRVTHPNTAPFPAVQEIPWLQQNYQIGGAQGPPPVR